MALDIQLQRLYDRVELIDGWGEPRDGKLCIMSLVAFLAGEGHSDRPESASPLIRDFAIPINDGMDGAMRQRLKAFAPRILGTRDGRDDERAEVLYSAMLHEVVPAMLQDVHGFGRERPRERSAEQLFLLWPELREQTVVRLLAGVRRLDRGDSRLVETVRTMAQAYRDGHHGALAEAAGLLFMLAARNAGGPARAAWYWTKAIEILDRLCDVGAGERVQPIHRDHVHKLETALIARRANGRRRPPAATSTLTR